MVLDVKRWLPEHPGGDKIIPAQSLRADAARHFELYHSSRESFLYLKHFYVGEVFADDRASVPLVPGPPASDDFLQQLREYTEDFRVDAAELPEENVRAHLARGASDARKRTRRESRQSVETWSFSVSRRISKRLAVGTPAVCVQRAPRVRNPPRVRNDPPSTLGTVPSVRHPPPNSLPVPRRRSRAHESLRGDAFEVGAEIERLASTAVEARPRAAGRLRRFPLRGERQAPARPVQRR